MAVKAIPATAVGRAKGRSTIASNTFLKGNSYLEEIGWGDPRESISGTVRACGRGDRKIRTLDVGRRSKGDSLRRVWYEPLVEAV